MLKEITTCDACGKDAANRRRYDVSVTLVKAPARNRRTSQRRSWRSAASTYLDVCTECFAAVVKQFPWLAPKLRGKSRRHR